METLIYIIPIILVCKILNFYRVSYETLKAENKINNLNNKLRELAIEGKIDPNSTGFLVVDNAMNKLKNNLDTSNILYLVTFYIKYNFIKKEKADLSNYNEIKKDALTFKVYNEFKSTITKHFLSKSIFSIIFIVLILLIPYFIYKGIKELFLQLINVHGIKISITRIKSYFLVLKQKMQSWILNSELNSNQNNPINLC